MPEGDTLFRTAAVLREALAGRAVVAARGRPDGVSLGRVVGARVMGVDARGKHLLIDFSNGLTLHTHLRMHGSWHRYRTGEPWRRTPARAVAVIEVPGAVAVCFDAPTVELLDTRAVRLHPALAALGPDLLAAAPDLDEALRRLRSPARTRMPLGEALLDQTAQAGLGNVYRSEVCFIRRLDPFTPLEAFSDGTIRDALVLARSLIHANRLAPARTTTLDAVGGAPGAGGPHVGPHSYVYGRTGRPCLRCGSPIRSRVTGDLPRRTYWCPGCQPPGAGSTVPLATADD
jgi:endonuclease VIII